MGHLVNCFRSFGISLVNTFVLYAKNDVVALVSPGCFREFPVKGLLHFIQRIWAKIISSFELHYHFNLLLKTFASYFKTNYEISLILGQFHNISKIEWLNGDFA